MEAAFEELATVVLEGAVVGLVDVVLDLMVDSVVFFALDSGVVIAF